MIALVVAANFLAHQLAETLNFQIRPHNEDAVHRAIMVSAVLYSVLLAIPFVPGAELGLALIAMLGPPIAFLVYVCTVAGLSLSFIAGRIFNLTGFIRLADECNFMRMSELLKSIEPLDQQARLALLANKASNRFLPFLLRHRYLALAVALNLPGNFLIGGGGGIALLAGVSRLYSVGGFLATVAVAVAPVPLAVLIFGQEFLEG
ncbi:MAG: hypothetical protein V2J55_16655 [Candidatus Competibacteraceae bacterium]|nr:hypothetical protein [Candidatus Competibacteraceae bacterium]